MSTKGANSIVTERVDDIPLLLHQLEQMNIPQLVIRCVMNQLMVIGMG